MAASRAARSAPAHCTPIRAFRTGLPKCEVGCGLPCPISLALRAFRNTPVIETMAGQVEACRQRIDLARCSLISGGLNAIVAFARPTTRGHDRRCPGPGRSGGSPVVGLRTPTNEDDVPGTAREADQLRATKDTRADGVTAAPFCRTMAGLKAGATLIRRQRSFRIHQSDTVTTISRCLLQPDPQGRPKVLAMSINAVPRQKPGRDE